MSNAAQLVVVGGGLAGMATAIGFGPGAVVFERDDRPGGLVRTDLVDGYWFDRVLHLLHFGDAAAEARTRALIGPVTLASVPPDAWIVTRRGTARFPIQHHLGDLDADAALECLLELLGKRGASPGANYGEVLRAAFGRTLFDLFFAPYNHKQWRVPLGSLAPDTLLWNLHRPSLADALRGALRPNASRHAYNQRALYPRPAEDAPWRGMEAVSRALAAAVPDLRVHHDVLALDPASKTATVRSGGRDEVWTWEVGAVTSAPLPRILARCAGVPTHLREARMPWNGVCSVAVRVRGPRPALGAWRYYPDPRLVFTRLVFLHAFDPGLAPAGGWPLLAEVTWRGEDGPPDPEHLKRRVLEDAHRVGVLAGADVEGMHVTIAAPAYVRFEHGVQEVVVEALTWLRERGIHPVGRYGRWEYSSMCHAMSDGLALGRALRTGA